MYGQTADHSQGFTLIELVLVLVIAGVIAAIAIPRFVELGSAAHRASVSGSAESFRTAVILVQVAYRVNGYAGPGTNDNVIGFGDGTVDVNTAGFPTDTANRNNINNATRCVNVWKGILGGAATISRSNQTAQDTDYKASRSGQSCTYTYTRDTSATRSFTYLATNGSVTLSNP